jgi:two-component sensor histidine kinase
VTPIALSQPVSSPAPAASLAQDTRHLALLYDLMTQLQGAGSREAIFAASARSLAGDSSDIPFAAFYSFSADGQRALLCGVSAIPRGHAFAPELISPETPHPWPMADVVRTGAMRPVGPLNEIFPDLAAGPWKQAPSEALLLPLTPAPGAAARGVLVLGVDPRRPRDDGFEQFAQEIACRIARALLSVEAVEAERERAKSADMLAQEVEHRRRIERQQNLLLDELNHRVRNTLATVQAIAMQTLKEADARDAFLARLFALSRQHDLLTLSNWEGASLEGVVRRALDAWRDREEGRARFVVNGPPVHLPPKRALALGLAFHELASNAVRHGALSGAEGQVQVCWVLDSGGKGLHLTWRESGGPRIAAPSPPGFGLRLIEEGLAREIGGRVELIQAPEGLTCSWEMKLS